MFKDKQQKEGENLTFLMWKTLSSVCESVCVCNKYEAQRYQVASELWSSGVHSCGRYSAGSLASVSVAIAIGVSVFVSVDYDSNIKIALPKFVLLLRIGRWL